MDWREWHDAYEDPDSNLSRRLRTVQERIRIALDEAPPGELRVISVCAGQGRDLLEVLPSHPRRDDVRARLVELDERNAAHARALASGLPTVEVVVGDAALTDSYVGVAPAHLVLLCGVFGNITDADIEGTIAACPQLCTHGGTVIWTRHRHEPDRFVSARAWFEAYGFEPVFTTPPDVMQGVGVHRFVGEPQPLATGRRLFTFVGHDTFDSTAG